MADECARVAQHMRRRHCQLEYEFSSQVAVRDTAHSVGAKEPHAPRLSDIGGQAGDAHKRLAGHDFYRLEYWGALRAFFNPYFLRSITRASRVR